MRSRLNRVRKSDKIKAIFKSFIQLLMLLFRARKRIQERISRNQSLLADGIRIYTEVLKNVLLQWLKTPIISVRVQDLRIGNYGQQGELQSEDA